MECGHSEEGKEQEETQQEKKANKHTLQIGQIQATHAHPQASHTPETCKEISRSRLSKQNHQAEALLPCEEGRQTLCKEGSSETLPLTLR